MDTKIDFYFDYLSPYAYLGWLRIKALTGRRGWALNPVPIVFGPILDHWGSRGPAEIPPKRAFVIRDSMRRASRLGKKISFPKFHPFNPLTALRLSLREVSGEYQTKVIDTIWELGWLQVGDLGSEEAIVKALEAANIPGSALLAKTNDAGIKDLLKGNTERAIELGVFGVPTFFVNGELFWGEDQIAFLENFVDGNDSLEQARYQDTLSRPSAVQRKKSLAGSEAVLKS